MKNIKYLFTNSIFGILFLTMLFSSVCFANIDNQTSLTVLHGNPSANATHAQQELQPLENYKPLAMSIKEPNVNKKTILQLDKFLTQITKSCNNNYIIAHSIGGVILFEFLKTIAKNP